MSKLTAAQEVLLAAAQLSIDGPREFSEWDLTVEAWKRNKNRFGCRGYEDEFPDHKRVMMEIMSQKKKDNPIRRGWMEKTRANHYRITSLGQAEGERLLQSSGGIKTAARSAGHIYDAISPYFIHAVFRKHCKDAEEPRMWLGAASFLHLTKNDAGHLQDRLTAVERAVSMARDWMKETGQQQLRRGVTGGGLTIRESDLELLDRFVGVLKARFKTQMDAIRRNP